MGEGQRVHVVGYKGGVGGVGGAGGVAHAACGLRCFQTSASFVAMIVCSLCSQWVVGLTEPLN